MHASPTLSPRAVHVAIDATVQGWSPHVATTAYLYARALSDGMLAPLDDPSPWARVPDALGMPAGSQQHVGAQVIVLDAVTWADGIARIHALALGQLECAVTGTRCPTVDERWSRWTVRPEALVTAGLTLPQLAAVFGGDVTAAATAFVLAADHDVQETSRALHGHRLNPGDS